MCQRALAIREKLLGPNHPDLTDSLFTLASVLRSLGKHKEALACCQRSMAIAEKTLDKKSALIADTLFVLGGVYSDIGDYPNALSAYQRGLAIDEKISGPDHPDTIEVLKELSVLFARNHDWQQSLFTCSELLKRQRRYLVGQSLALSDPDAVRWLCRSFQYTELLLSVCDQVPASSSITAFHAAAAGLALGKAFLEEVRAAQAAFDAHPSTTTRASAGAVFRAAIPVSPAGQK